MNAKEKISEKAISCPECGYPVSEYMARPWTSLNELGECFKDNNGDEWMLLGKDTHRHLALIIFKDIVETRAYHTVPTAISGIPRDDYSYRSFLHKEHGEICLVTWEDCDLRRYLNTVFFDNLPLGLKENTVATRNENKVLKWNGATGYQEEPGNVTKDKVWLLSWREYTYYFDRGYSDIARRDNSTEWWWLRAPHKWDGSQSIAAHRYAFECHEFAGTLGGVRPAIFLNL